MGYNKWKQKEYCKDWWKTHARLQLDRKTYEKFKKYCNDNCIDMKLLTSKIINYYLKGKSIKFGKK
jgi:hypothetical protein